ncbi:hypothetical protein E8E14_009574 [Neopestalotiopsis sp. 37M]|nr:hypothetical protein E8E14_009574 [Neopestalotiopsis sp. 37M]
MKQMINTFMRVQRKLDDADSLAERFPELERAALLSESAAKISDQDRRRLLDIPDQDVESANLAAVTELSKAQLLERAVKSPNDLTDAESELLWRRYWRHVSWTEGSAAMHARDILFPGRSFDSPDPWEDLEVRLARARQPLYEENELEAWKNAGHELSRRRKADFEAQQAEEIGRVMREAAPWIQRLWVEDLQDQGPAVWGYAIFRDPAIEAEMGDMAYDDYLVHAGGIIKWAKMALRCGSTIESRFRQSLLKWPADLNSPRQAADGGQQDLGATFQRLREVFKSARAAPRQNGQQGLGIDDNLLRNVFLVVDRDAANSHLSKWPRTIVREAEPGRPAMFSQAGAGVDDAWVWAVDPDFEPENAPVPDEREDKSERYQGYLRVRMQQLVKNFYEARRWHADKFPMEALWKAAQISRNQLFVSVNEDEAKQWTLSRDTGSAMRGNRDMVSDGDNLSSPP